MTTESINGCDIQILDTHALVCTTSGHNKFWRGTLGLDSTAVYPGDKRKPYVVVLAWGRIGTLGNTDKPDVKRFPTQGSAQVYLNGRLKDKYHKGYVAETATPAVTPPKAPAAAKLRSVPYKENTYEWDLF